MERADFQCVVSVKVQFIRLVPIIVKAVHTKKVWVGCLDLFYYFELPTCSFSGIFKFNFIKHKIMLKTLVLSVEPNMIFTLI